MNLVALQSDNPLLRTRCLLISKKELRDKNVQEQIDALVDFVYGGNNKGKDRNVSKPMTVGLSGNKGCIGKKIFFFIFVIWKKKFNIFFFFINPEIFLH